MFMKEKENRIDRKLSFYIWICPLLTSQSQREGVNFNSQAKLLRQEKNIQQDYRKIILKRSKRSEQY